MSARSMREQLLGLLIMVLASLGWRNNMAAEGAGNSQWRGFSPALDLAVYDDKML